MCVRSRRAHRRPGRSRPQRTRPAHWRRRSLQRGQRPVGSFHRETTEPEGAAARRRHADHDAAPRKARRRTLDDRQMAHARPHRGAHLQLARRMALLASAADSSARQTPREISRKHPNGHVPCTRCSVKDAPLGRTFKAAPTAPVPCAGSRRPQHPTRSRSSWPSTGSALGLHPGTKLRTVSLSSRSPAPARPEFARPPSRVALHPRCVSRRERHRKKRHEPGTHASAGGLQPMPPAHLGVQRPVAGRFFSFEIPLRGKRKLSSTLA